jgi:hypothetical protein
MTWSACGEASPAQTAGVRMAAALAAERCHLKALILLRRYPPPAIV